MDDEVYIPPEALKAAEYAVSCCWQPTEENFADRVPALNSAYEKRWPGAVWRAAVKRALANNPVIVYEHRGSRAPSKPKRPIWMPEFRFFYHEGKDTYVALLSSEVEFLDKGGDMFKQLVEVREDHVEEDVKAEAISLSLAHYVKLFGL